ncbi:MAG: cation transporter [Candidatus Eisenbacteria bacterium]|uniref:Cation transporter n=1 Tax=Eiseniibacteriota bacterium TaxID=2212470 RepID=A0A938BML5_UNCEI|nr:cation transporter [Candidatus Eisenbacteria bacterium]
MAGDPGHHDPTADREKRSAASSSVVAALGLTGAKLLVGLLTGSLGILAEAAHSGLDLVAALATLLAVRIAARPADADHPYGHGKVENLSALFQTLLLLGTCVWIIREAVERLLHSPVRVDATFWAFAVMALSIAVDVSRSRLLYRMARKHQSPALEADGLHFRTDIWSSSVVLLGLAGVAIADRHPRLAFLHHADPVAALIVAGIVVLVSVRLAVRSIQPLLDTAPAGVAEKVVAAVEALPGVIDCHQVRVRRSGPHAFVDAHVTVDGGQTLEQAHRLTEEIEVAVGRVVPRADVTLHPEPAPRAAPDGLGPEAARTVPEAVPRQTGGASAEAPLPGRESGA